MSFLLNSRNELRTGWKFLSFIVVLMPVWIAASLGVRIILVATLGAGDNLHDLAFSELVNLIAVVIATVFAARILEHIPIRILGLGFHKDWTGNLGKGAGVAGSLIALLMLGTHALGQVHTEWTASQNAPGRMALTAGMIIVGAAFEELLFRGYPLQVLIKGIGPWPAMIAMSCIFGLLHALNPNSSWIGVLNTIVAGMLLSLAYLRTRSLWFPYGFHVAWNIGTGMVVGFPLSGLVVASLWTTHVVGSASILGGEYGPEGGALGTLILLAGTVAVWKLPIRSTNYQL